MHAKQACIYKRKSLPSGLYIHVPVSIEFNIYTGKKIIAFNIYYMIY